MRPVRGGALVLSNSNQRCVESSTQNGVVRGVQSVLMTLK